MIYRLRWPTALRPQLVSLPDGFALLAWQVVLPMKPVMMLYFGHWNNCSSTDAVSKFLFFFVVLFMVKNWRERQDSNLCNQICTLVPNHSATLPDRGVETPRVH